MAATGNGVQDGWKLRAICDRLDVDYDDARYTLAKGALPDGVDVGPGKGNHRIFSHRQAFMLAVILKLKAAGVSTAVAKNIAEWSRRVQGMAVNLGWDFEFAPFSGELKSDCVWYLDVGDAHFARIVTDAEPSTEGEKATPWVDMKTRRKQPNVRPAVVFRVDMVRIAELLRGPSVVE